MSTAGKFIFISQNYNRELDLNLRLWDSIYMVEQTKDQIPNLDKFDQKIIELGKLRNK